ncbi:uncharacterized protein LOC131669141 [Phymastichus coffea]|uniref:uncharacterized protein LOC131669141 n=1 Tax=Phymastichus coffea TaxID=108790 RepID=UPI00273C6E58|nr:uncharacterized protein LOC131669141 [Phymastichus coffea]
MTLSPARTTSQARRIQKCDELIAILRSAGVKLDKWAATHPELLPSSTTQGNGCASKKIDSEKAVKTLGVHWSPSLDCFSFTTDEIECRREKLTKRTISSDIARLFDPLGWLVPITMTAKTILQDLWLEKIDWDARVSGEVFDRWLTYCRSLGFLSSLSVPRWLGLSQRKSYEVHGFSDASKRAYAAVVYLLIDNDDGTFAVSLLAAKTKVAPVKTVSIPNLELLGAVLTVKLVRHLQGLEFVRSAPTELPSATWDHVPTKQNPADIASRGATPAELKSLDLWWQGPPWLASHSQAWPQSPETVKVLHTKSRNDEPEVLSRYSTLTILTRVTAWYLRPFLQYTRRKAQEGLYTPFFSTAELDNARQVILKLAQSHAFACEIELLRDGKGLKRHALHSLRPFLDSDGVLRVGGHLSNAPLPSHVRNPPILPRQSALSRLFVAHAHCKALHGGPTLTISVLLRFAWIIGMRALIKSAIRKCVKCQRHKPRLAHQLMGNLPAERVTPARPFTITGLDYARPFQVRTSKGRGQRAFKGYIALFVCFATKAIHLELVSDLTTATFIAAFRRFVSRRGLCKQLVSDNATTFRGADAELRAMFRASSIFFQEVASTLANDGITWTFIPPTTSHYGGFATSGLIPDEKTPAVPIYRLSRFQLLQRIRDQFWKRWTSEYVLLLQERGIGQLVLLKDDRYPASKWLLGRMLEMHAGSDGAVRLVTMKTANNTFRRHVACLAPLTLDHQKDQEESAKWERSARKTKSR